MGEDGRWWRGGGGGGGGVVGGEWEGVDERRVKGSRRVERRRWAVEGRGEGGVEGRGEGGGGGGGRGGGKGGWRGERRWGGCSARLNIIMADVA